MRKCGKLAKVEATDSVRFPPITDTRNEPRHMTGIGTAETNSADVKRDALCASLLLAKPGLGSLLNLSRESLARRKLGCRAVIAALLTSLGAFARFADGPASRKPPARSGICLPPDRYAPAVVTDLD